MMLLRKTIILSDGVTHDISSYSKYGTKIAFAANRIGNFFNVFKKVALPKNALRNRPST